MIYIFVTLSLSLSLSLSLYLSLVVPAEGFKPSIVGKIVVESSTTLLLATAKLG
jgi:hypothetical protein